MRCNAAAALVALALVSGAAAAPAPLEEQKLRAEIHKLELENERAGSGVQRLLDFAPFLTILVAAGGLVFPVWREAREHRRQRERELRQRFDEQFATAIGNLGAESPAVQVSAVVALENFLRPEYAEFHAQVYRVLCANLGAAPDDLVSRFLVRAFARSARLAFPPAPVGADGVVRASLARAAAPDAADAPRARRDELDLAHCRAPRLDLSGLDLAASDLTGADLAYAQLQRATLTGCVLFRAKGFEVHLERARLSRSDLREIRFKQAHCNEAQFHRSVLVSADLRDAELERAEFHQADLQGARFAGAKLAGARFNEANLADAHFKGATLDDAALKTIVLARAGSWRKAHFDPDAAEKLARLDAKRARTSRAAAVPVQRTSTGSTPTG